MYRYYYIDESSSNAIPFLFLPLPFVYHVLKSLIHFWLLFVVCFCGTKRPRPVVEQQFFVYCIAQVQKKKKCNGSIIRFVCILYIYTCPCAFALNIWKTKNMKKKRKALAPVPILTTDCCVRQRFSYWLFKCLAAAVMLLFVLISNRKCAYSLARYFISYLYFVSFHS